MSAKKLKQMRLPFALLVSPASESSPKAAERSAPKTPVASRKRKPSTDGDNARSNKIGRKDSKENIASEQDILEIKDSDDEEEPEIEEISEEDTKVKNETTPTAENVLHIKLPSCSKSKRKINMDVKPPKAFDEDNEDDSIVNLDGEEIPKSCKKSKKTTKKSEKKKKKETTDHGGNKAKKTLKLGISVEEEVCCADDEKMEVDDEVKVTSKEVKNGDLKSEKDDVECEDQEEAKADKAQKSIEADDKEEKLEVSKKSPEKLEATQEVDEIKKDFNTIPSNASSPQVEDPDAIHDEIVEVLSDNSEASDINLTSPPDDTNKTPSSGKVDISKLTPKQLARRQEQEARRLEKEMLRQKERDMKEQQRLKEKEQREEVKRKEKEEKEESRKKEKEDRDRKRQAEQDKKDEEKRQKEEERKRLADQRDEEKRVKDEERKRQAEQRDEEKRKRDEAQKKKEIEEENRKKRAAQVFSKFFVAPKKKVESSNIAEDETSKDSAVSGETLCVLKSNFMPFQVRERMMVAPCVRLQISKEQLKALEESLKVEKPVDGLYLKELKNGNHKPKTSGKTWPLDDKEDERDDVIAVDDLEGVGEDIQADEAEIKMKHRAKFLMFTENRRPAFHGTWRKKTTNIYARRPFAQDLKFFDYEVDSDEEWEEEEPGESLHGSDSEKEKDGAEEDYEVDNDFFVPHGHLSDEEMQQMDDDQDDNHPEAQKAKLKILQQEFAAEMKKKTEKIKPRLIGCIWLNGDEDENGCTLDKKYHCSDIIWRILKARETWTSSEAIKMEDKFEPELPEPEEETEKSSVPKTPATIKTQPKAKFNDGSVKDLLRLVHGNLNSRKFIVREFQAYRLKNYHKEADFLEFSQKNVDEKMLESADYKSCPDEGPLFGKKCWYVKPDVMQEFFGEDKLKLPNEWNYILEKEVKEKKPKQPASKIIEGEKKEELSPPVVNEAAKIIPSVFKALSKSQPAKASPIDQQSSAAPTGAVKKRVQLLMSVPRGQPISESKKNSLISQFIQKGQQSTDKATTSTAETPLATSSKMDVDEDVIVLD